MARSTRARAKAKVKENQSPSRRDNSIQKQGEVVRQDDEKTIIHFERFCIVQTLRSHLISVVEEPKSQPCPC